MPFVKGETYVALRDFTTYDVDETLIRIEKGSSYKCDANKHLIDQVTGEVHKIQNHVAYRSDWYFKRKGSIASASFSITQQEYVQTIMRFGDGLDLDALFAIAEDEEFGPLSKPMAKNTFSSCITLAVATGRFEPRRNGELVTGIGHNKRYCTYHVVSKKVA